MSNIYFQNIYFLTSTVQDFLKVNNQQSTLIVTYISGLLKFHVFGLPTKNPNCIELPISEASHPRHEAMCFHLK